MLELELVRGEGRARPDHSIRAGAPLFYADA
jgi:hypothetical protein